MSMEEPEYVWVCKKCLRVVSDEFGKPLCHATTKDAMDFCDGEWIKKPIW